MSSSDVLDSIAAKLDTATTYQAVFGAIPSGKGATKYLQREAIKKAYHMLSLMVHPDKFESASKPVKELSAKVFDKLRQMYEHAERAVDAGTYDKPIGAESMGDVAAVELTSTNGIYLLEEKPVAYGDFSVMYRGHKGTQHIIAKIASTPPHNIWLEQEAKTLELFHTRPNLAEVGKYVPKILDAFYVTNAGKRYRTHIIADNPHLLSVKDLMDAFTEGMPPQDAAWVCRRILGQVASASMAGLVHCAITPDHVLVDSESHDPMSIGWGHALPKGEIQTRIVDRWRAYYAPEVFAHQPVTVATDIFMAGKTMVALLGGDLTTDKMPKVVPAAMAAVIKKCTNADPTRRFQTGKEALDEMTRVARDTWGKVFRQLKLPEPLPPNNFAQVVDRELDLSE